MNRKELLSILAQNSRTPVSEIAMMLGCTEADVEREIATLEEEKVILGYTAQINEESLNGERVTAMIQVRCTPQKEQGFDHIAEQIYRYPEVRDCYLMSGGFDLMLIVCCKSLKEVAMFVSEKVSRIDAVTGTETLFILKNYKMNGIEFDLQNLDHRETIIL